MYQLHPTHGQLRFSKSCLSTCELLSSCSRVRKLLALLLALGGCEVVTPSPNSIWKWRRGSESDLFQLVSASKMAEFAGSSSEFGQCFQSVLIGLLNPVIRGWANYHRHCAAKETFDRVDHEIWPALCQWARRRHPKKSRDWVKKRCFPTHSSTLEVLLLERCGLSCKQARTRPS